jgi:phenylalanyl-tRNA synthetase beta chain
MFPRAVSEGLGIHLRISAFELDVDALAGAEVQPRRFEALPRFPASPRDLAVVIKEETLHAEAEAVIREGGRGILESVQLFDVYRGGALAERREKSFAYSLVFRHRDRTLTDEEVNGAFASILSRLSERLGARLRD